jgi:hypothetical protein
VNTLYVGLKKDVELPETGGFLLIDDEYREVPKWRNPRLFDPTKHSFNVLKDIDYRKACDLVSAIMAIFPGGENTLTKEGVPLVLLDAFLAKPERFDQLLKNKSKDPSYISAQRMISRLMKSPILRGVLCNKTNFTFNENSANMARLNRSEIGEFDARAIGLLLMAVYKYQFVIPDLGFYGCDAHVGLAREGRVIAGVNFFSELPEELRDAMLLMSERIPSGTTYEDAVTLAQYAALHPDPTREDNPYNRFIQSAME